MEQMDFSKPIIDANGHLTGYELKPVVQIAQAAMQQPVQQHSPDDKMTAWKEPNMWSLAEIEKLVMDEVGCDLIVPRGYNVLVSLWVPPEMDDHGLHLTDHAVKKGTIQSTLGKIIRMGADAFTDRARFPSGPTVTYGEWGIFRGSERQPIGINGKRLALIHDDRFIAATGDPNSLQTSFELEFEWANN